MATAKPITKIVFILFLIIVITSSIGVDRFTLNRPNVQREFRWFPEVFGLFQWIRIEFSARTPWQKDDQKLHHPLIQFLENPLAPIPTVSVARREKSLLPGLPANHSPLLSRPRQCRRRECSAPRTSWRGGAHCHDTHCRESGYCRSWARYPIQFSSSARPVMSDS